MKIPCETLPVTFFMPRMSNTNNGGERHEHSPTEIQSIISFCLRKTGNRQLEESETLHLVFEEVSCGFIGVDQEFQSPVESWKVTIINFPTVKTCLIPRVDLGFMDTIAAYLLDQMQLESVVFSYQVLIRQGEFVALETCWKTHTKQTN